MFAAASGARLAQRHNKTAQKQQLVENQIEGFHIRSKGLAKHHLHYHHQYYGQPIKYSDVAAFRYPGIPQRKLPPSSKLFSSDYNPGFKVSTSYVDIKGRISNLGQIDFEGKAAWQDRDFYHELDRRESACILNEAQCSSKLKQKEAHRRWARKNRIQDLSCDDHSSDEKDYIYGAQNGAANLLLYIGLGTMCVGMIIAFVGTGEKGFKTIELRFIGPSLIGAGVLIIILRVLLCVCPSKCLRLENKKHKLKNSTDKSNSEINKSKTSKKNGGDNNSKSGEKTLENSKKQISIVMPPGTPSFNANLPTPSQLQSSQNFKTTKSQPKASSRPPSYSIGLPPQSTTYQENPIPSLAVSFMEQEKPSSSKAWTHKTGSGKSVANVKKSQEAKTTIQMTDLIAKDADSLSLGSIESCKSVKNRIERLPEISSAPDEGVSLDASASIASGFKEYLNLTKNADKATATTPTALSGTSKFEMTRNPKNLATTAELVLCPSNLNESETE